MRFVRWFAPLLIANAACGSASVSMPPLDDRAPVPRLASAQVRAQSAEAESTAAPPLLNRKRKRLQPPTERRLSNGIRVLFLERHEFPAIWASFVLDRGSAAAPPGVAALYSEVIDGDSGDFKGKEASEFFQYVGARTSTWATRDGVGIQVRVLSPLYDGALVRVASMFTSPLLASDDLARGRREAVAAAGRSNESPSATAQKTVRAMVLGKTHPYATPVYAGGEARFEKMSRNELENFRSMFLVPERMTVIVAGDFNQDAVLSRLEHRLGKIAPKKSAAAPDATAQASPTKGRIVVVPRKGASQSNVAIGFVGVPKVSDDQAALAVLQTLLARGLSGRLDLKARGEHGTTYGVAMSSPSYRTAGTIEISAAIDAPHTATTVKGLLTELARIGSEPIPPDELRRAKLYAISSLANGSANDVVGLLESIAIEGLPLDHFEKLAARIEALDEAAVRAVAARLFTTDRAQIAVVGDPEVTVAPLRALGVGDVELEAQP